MSDFFEFYNHEQLQKSKSLAKSSHHTPAMMANSVLAAAAHSSIPNNAKGEKLHNLAKNVAQDKDFLKDLSDAIGDPEVDESEDMFVKRASEAMRSLLRNKLS